MKIANRYRPFLHRPGAQCLLPGTFFTIKAYPTKVILTDPSGKEYKIDWDLKGLIKEFTLMQDLENQSVSISGLAESGYFKYKICLEEDHLCLKLERYSLPTLEGLFSTEFIKVEISLKKKSSFKICKASSSLSLRLSIEKLSFGHHKAQDWEMIVKRKNPLEYLPFWFLLGQLTPGEIGDLSKGAIIEHFDKAVAALNLDEKEQCLKKLHEVFLLGFEGLMVPQSYDKTFSFKELSSQKEELPSSLSILSSGYDLIKKMILSKKEESIVVLRDLPSIFHCGRALNFSLEGSLFDLEWSKKMIKKIHLTVFNKQKYLFSFQNSLKTFRLKEKSSKKGSTHSCFEHLILEPGFYTLDQFKK